MRFNPAIINQICDNVITAVADPDMTINGDFIVTGDDYDNIVESVSNAIGGDYCVGTDNGYFGPDGDIVIKELTVFNQNQDYDIVASIRFLIMDIKIA